MKCTRCGRDCIAHAEPRNGHTGVSGDFIAVSDCCHAPINPCLSGNKASGKIKKYEKYVYDRFERALQNHDDKCDVLHDMVIYLSRGLDDAHNEIAELKEIIKKNS
jgi:hypothetical protein